MMGKLLAGMAVGTAMAAHADVLRCTVSVVDGQVYLNDCDSYTDADLS